MEKEVKYEVDKKVTLELIERATSETQGVYSVKKDIWGKGIKITKSEKGLNIFLSLIVEEGALIPRVAEEVQKKVTEEVQKSLGTSVARVDIKIKGIKFSKVK